MEFDPEGNENHRIVSKYEKGRGNVTIENWEDPKLSIYHTTDRYGFIHDKPLPRSTLSHDKRQLIEAERVNKWVKMGRKWDKFKGTEKLYRRVYKGIPDRVRGTFWGKLLDLDRLIQRYKGMYQELLAFGKEYSCEIRQIDLDVNRTYRDHISFRERYSTSQISLFNILCAYSVYNPDVGYCQGMSQIGALLLMYMAEEEAFWGLVQLMSHPKFYMHGFFVCGFPKYLRFQSHHDKLLRKMLPKLSKHLAKHEVDSGLYTLKWFFQCFLDRVPFELALRLWDVYFLEGERVLICGAYTILKLHSKQLLMRKSMDSIIEYIQTIIPYDFGMDYDRVLEYYQEFSDDLQRKKLDQPGSPGPNEFATKPFGLSSKQLVNNIALPSSKLTTSFSYSTKPPQWNYSPRSSPSFNRRKLHPVSTNNFQSSNSSRKNISNNPHLNLNIQIPYATST